MGTPAFTLSWYDLIFFGTLIIGLTTAFQLIFYGPINARANPFLGGALLVMSLGLSQLLVRGAGWAKPLSLSFLFSLGPLLYFYVQKLTNPAGRFRRIDCLHFLPVLTEPFNWINSINYVLPVLLFSSVLVYLYFCRRLIESFYRRLEFSGGDRQRHQLTWLDVRLKTLIYVWIFWVPYYVVSAYSHWSVQSAYPVLLISSFILIRIGWLALFRVVLPLRVGTSFSIKRVTGLERKQKGTWLKKLSSVKRYMRIPISVWVRLRND